MTIDFADFETREAPAPAENETPAENTETSGTDESTKTNENTDGAEAAEAHRRGRPRGPVPEGYVTAADVARHLSIEHGKYTTPNEIATAAKAKRNPLASYDVEGRTLFKLDEAVAAYLTRIAEREQRVAERGPSSGRTPVNLTTLEDGDVAERLTKAQERVTTLTAQLERANRKRDRLAKEAEKRDLPVETTGQTEAVTAPDSDSASGAVEVE